MKYVVTMNGKQYEVEVERMSAFHQLTREEIASGVSTPVVPVVAPVPVQAAPVAAAPKPAPAPAPAPHPHRHLLRQQHPAAQLPLPARCPVPCSA